MPQFDTTQWQKVLEVLKERHAPICRQWFYDDLSPGQLNNGLLEIHTATPVQQNYLQKRCLEPFTEAAQAVTGQLVAARFVCEPVSTEDSSPSVDASSSNGHAPLVEPELADLEANLPPTPPNSTEQDAFTPAASKPEPIQLNKSRSHDARPATGSFDFDNESMVLSPDNSFDHFISGPNNQLAYAAAVAVANQPGTAYNPLFIHGGVGLGKTHLLQAICQSILTKNPHTQILYVSCDAFMNQFIACVQAGKMDEFRHHYRHVDLLVIDDIHFLANRERSQEEFFHTFNELYQSNRQIVLSSDAPPHEIPHLEDRLVSRFQWGLVATVSKPSFETRVAIVKAKAKMRGFELPDAVVELVAQRRESNARELEGAIKALQAQQMIQKRPVDLAMARQALGEPAVAPQANQTTLQHIVDAVTRYYNVKLSDLQSRRRFKSIVEPRQICMYLARERTRFSLEEIGGFFGGRDHTTVMHSVDVVENRLQNEAGFPPQIKQLLEEIDRATGAVT
ncbi:chromosomal replication initiator protein DnaA [Algisphaera agarilytica]|uniref:Chromosomal replication initiator protein DnaA n=1 Tax=Algisphaera agarilytica TaxID=1385975 RepID=A0A7X0LL54_9BACT|nr:chromosomal replication initiator protein DnaA [Algisphaera agarilytica]MBB6429633.1 chromosomal replication initiator protein [Algisphaera agarilytica]